MVGPKDMLAIEEEEMEEVSEAAEKEKKVEVGGWRRSWSWLLKQALFHATIEVSENFACQTIANNLRDMKDVKKDA